MADPLIKVACAMADRLKLFRKLRYQAEERGETEITLHPAELFEPSDAKALDEFEALLRKRNGERSLFEEMP